MKFWKLVVTQVAIAAAIPVTPSAPSPMSFHLVTSEVAAVTRLLSAKVAASLVISRCEAVQPFRTKRDADMDLIVEPDGALWRARYGDLSWRCAIGRGGLRPVAEKVEGDGTSPIGRWPLRQLFYRADKIDPPITHLPSRAITPQDGWCDDPRHPDYNRFVNLPFSASHEDMFRQDDLYDCVVVLGHNDDPVVAGGGSAIFLHVADVEYGSTAGCAALARDDLLAFLALAKPGTHLSFRETT